MDVGPLAPNISPQMDTDDDLLYVSEAYQEMQRVEHDHQLKLAEMRDEFWKRQNMSEPEYRRALAELDQEYNSQRIAIASFGDSYHYNAGEMAPRMVKHMTRDEYEGAIEQFIVKQFEKETERVKNIKYKRRLEAPAREQNRELFGAFGDISRPADLEDVILERPKRQPRDSWWWRLLADLSAILLLLLDWLAPPREKRKNDDA